tara:strand:+ start:3570 stop:4196 length:627 start_codon:yes stop_codon:yes gene_type:complete
MLTLNEEENISFMIDEIKQRCPSYDLIIIDGFSTDNTVKIAKEKGIPVYKREKHGYGNGIRTAIKVAYENEYDALLKLDCDRTYPASHIKKLIEKIPEYDYAVGNRSMKNVEFGHRYPNMFFNILTSIVYGKKFNDVNCGMWAMKPKKFHKLVKQDGWDVTIELSIIAAKNKYKMAQIPIPYMTRVGDSKIKVRDGFTMLYRILRNRF